VQEINVLDYTTRTTLSIPTTSPTITGRNLAHGKHTKTARALMAADLVAGRVKLIRPTVKQAAALARVSAPYVYAAAKPDPAQRRKLERGVRLMNVVRPTSLTREWCCATREQKIAFIRSVGTDSVWNAVESVIDAATETIDRDHSLEIAV
jgi:hypothetical protein